MAVSQDNNPVSVSISQVIVYKAPFTNSSCAFRMQEWSILTRDDVLHLCRTLPLVSFLVGWLAHHHTFTLKMATAMFAEMLDNPQHLMQLMPESQSYTQIINMSTDFIWNIFCV
jgi:hypothetical protein